MKLFLKENIQLAPYIGDWYAWSHLLPPHTAAANIAERHIKIMESFVEAPGLHHEAIHLHGMIGGPFIHLAPCYKEKVSDLLNKTKQSNRLLLQLHDAIKSFSYYLISEAKGFNVDHIYYKLPIELKGLVELTYDLYNHPQMRFIEPLLYNKYYRENDQSICLSENIDDKRPYSLSTPYITNHQSVQLSIPFHSSIIDELARMKYMPQPFKNILAKVDIPENKINLFRSFFTDAPHRFYQCDYQGNDIRVRYFGHACVLLQSPKTSILIDPLLGYPTHITNHDRYTMHDLPEVIDYVLITHNHQDHLLFESLLQLRHKIKTIVVPANNTGSLTDPSLKLILHKLGFKNILVLDEFDQITLTEGMVTALPFYGEHGDLNIYTKASYHIRLMENSFMFLADSNNLDSELYYHIHQVMGNIDVIFIGMECMGAPVSWLYGPLFPQALIRENDQSRRLSGSNAEKAWNMIKIFHPKEVYIYALGMEPWLGYITAIDYKDDSLPIIESNKLIQQCRQENMICQRLYGKQEWQYKFYC